MEHLSFSHPEDERRSQPLKIRRPFVRQPEEGAARRLRRGVSPFVRKRSWHRSCSCKPLPQRARDSRHRSSKPSPPPEVLIFKLNQKLKGSGKPSSNQPSPLQHRVWQLERDLAVTQQELALSQKRQDEKDEVISMLLDSKKNFEKKQLSRELKVMKTAAGLSEMAL